MPDINHVLAWFAAHRALGITGAALIGLVIIGAVTAQVVAGYRGRTLSARASLGFSVVQAGVAYVTITGVYEFWARRVGMPTVESAFIAGFIEAVTWAAVGMIFAHGATPNSHGTGPAGNVFWTSIIGGGLMAICGAPTFAVALGRIVVVTLGANMWWLRIRLKTRRPLRAATRFRITPRQVAIRLGWLAADDEDVVESSREWEIRRLTRAIRRKANGRGPTRWAGGRAIQRVMEAGDVDMVREAQGRYALQTILGDDLKPDSESMVQAIAAARAALYPPPAPEPAPVLPPEQADPPAPVPARRRPAPSRTSAASAARNDTANAAKVKAAAVEYAHSVIVLDGGLIDGRPISGRAVGSHFGMGEEWGRKCLVEARNQVETERQPVPVD